MAEEAQYIAADILINIWNAWWAFRSSSFVLNTG